MLQEVPSVVQQGVQSLLSDRGIGDITGFSFVGGGCINHSGRLKTDSADFFLKWNDAIKFKAMFETEALGLQLFRDPNIISVPEVIGYGEARPYQFLLLEFINQSPPSKNYWSEFGKQLAQIHRIRGRLFGLHRDNYMGSLPQSNEESDSWSSFFIKRRLQPQVQRAQNAGLLDSKSVKAFELLYKNLQDLLPEEEPALLHGDLWSGNLITNSDGGPCLIDPAVYYGNREVDLAMTRLFGGFSQEFYDAYHEAFPLPPNDFDRVDLYNLYPLLVHLNLFGSSYLPGIKATLRRFGE